MKNYFTFFFCTRDWGRVEQTVFPVVEKLLEVLRSSTKIQATAQLKSHGAQGAPETLSGSYSRLRRDIRPEDLAQLILIAAGKTPGVQEFFLFFESVRYQHTPEYLRFISPQAPERVEADRELKIFSFSMRRDLFERELDDEQRSALRAVLERLFVQASCVYGFGHPTTWPISGPYQFVRDNSVTAGRRIADFDYASQIEDAYVCNYLSESHLREIAALDPMCKATAVVECKRLYDDLQQPCGMAVYLKDTSAETLSLVAGNLRTLISVDGPPPISFHLLLQGEACNAEAKKALGNYSFAGQVKGLPDFIRVALRETVGVEDNREFYAGLTEFFERLCPDLHRGGKYVAEMIVQYPGLFEPHQVFQRIPLRRFAQAAGDEDCAKLYLTPDVRPERLKLLFLVNAGVASEPLAKLEELVQSWVSALNRHPDDYGRVIGIEAFTRVTINHKAHAEMLIDATHLKQDGLNLLMLMLDEANRKEFIVRFLVCGELPPGSVPGISA